jgi:hypothetical protein
MNRGNLKISRNALCPCGSGIKYKKCCLNRRLTTSTALREEMRMQVKEKIEKKIEQKITLIENTSGLKMSEVIIEFAQELLSQAKTRAEEERMIQLACTAWNFALLKQRNRRYRNQFRSLFKQMIFKDSAEENAARLLIEHFVNKKIACYHQIDRWIIRCIGLAMNYGFLLLRLEFLKKEIVRGQLTVFL